MMPAGARLLVERSRVEAAYDALAEALERDLPDGDIVMLPVMNGGMFPACELSRRLSRRVSGRIRFDYVHATRYRGRRHGAAIHWERWPTLPEDAATVVVIDDIFDEGHTLAAIRARIAPKHRIVTVALVRKLHARGLARDWIDHAGLDIEDVYAFGCGMDLDEHYRELPEIWAVAEAQHG